MNKVLSIVVPTYNMQDYLPRCLDSLVLPDAAAGELEVMVINDGSKDRSSEIAHSYENRYPDVFRVIDKENGNYGSCINRGLAEARGKYIKILDADDWFDGGQFLSYIDSLEKLDVDMVINDYRIVNPQGETERSMTYSLPTGDAFDFDGLKDNGLYISMHSIAYRTSLLRDMEYVQTEGISYTDNEWAYYPQLFVRTCVYLKHDVYRYMLGREGQTMDSRVMSKSMSHKLKLMRSMITFCNNVEESSKSLNAYSRIQAYIVHTSLGIYRDMLVKQPASSFNGELMKSFDRFVKDSYAALYEKAGLLVLKPWLPIRYVAVWRKLGIRLLLVFPFVHGQGD